MVAKYDTVTMLWVKRRRQDQFDEARFSRGEGRGIKQCYVSLCVTCCNVDVDRQPVFDRPGAVVEDIELYNQILGRRQRVRGDQPIAAFDLIERNAREIDGATIADHRSIGGLIRYTQRACARSNSARGNDDLVAPRQCTGMNRAGRDDTATLDHEGAIDGEPKRVAPAGPYEMPRRW